MKPEIMKRFLAELAAGEIPRTSTTEAVAAEFRAALAPKRKRGRPPRSSTEVAEITGFITRAIAADPSQRGARERAIEAAAEKFGKGTRAIERIWDAPFLRVRFSPEELELIGGEDGDKK